MPGTTISGSQGNGLYELVRNHLGSVGELWDALERDKDFATAARLGLEFGEDFDLLDDIGWAEDEGRESFELTRPVHDLTELLKRLHGEAEQVLQGKGSGRQAREDDQATEERYLRGLDACEELLIALDEREESPYDDDQGNDQAPAPRRAGRAGAHLHGQAQERGAVHRLDDRQGNRPLLRCRRQLPCPAGKAKASSPCQAEAASLRPESGEVAMRSASRPRFPESIPPGLNHSILTGKLMDSPQLSKSPAGDPITLLQVKFPVADPEHPQRLWAWASCEVEVPDALADRHGIRELQGGASILVAGQLSERWVVADGRKAKRGAIVAALVHPGPPSTQPHEMPMSGDLR
jgi:hypothetical protein